MDIKIIIPTLISSAYFLALFLFNLFKTTNILNSLFKCLICSGGLFVIVYILVLYIEHSLNSAKDEETLKTIQQIQKIELETEKKDLYHDEQSKLSQTNKIESARKINNIKEQDIDKIKRESGTQFDHDFARHGKFDI